MALNSNELSSKIQANLKADGFKSISQNTKLCDAIAKAVVEHITLSAEVPVNAGSSAGTYKVK